MLVHGGRKHPNLELSEKAYLVSRERNEFAPDYKFQWVEATQTSQQGQQGIPVARVGATLLTLADKSELLLIGGKEANEVSARVWRGRIVNDQITWTEVFNQSTTNLPALHGHGAVYDKTVNRVFVFGGSENADETPTNSNVYSIAVSDNATDTWMWVSPATASGPSRPNPRSYGSLTHVPYLTRGVPGLHADTGRTRAMLFGGRTMTAGYSDSLHAMWIHDSTTVIWEAVGLDPASPRPTARAKHGASLDANTLSLVISGGETALNTGSDEVWTHSIICGANKRCNESANQRWVEQPPLNLSLRGHASAVIGTEAAFSRFPEIMDPSSPSPSWTTLTAVPHWQEWFPFGFAAPRRPTDPAGADSFRVFYAGPEKGSPTLHLSRAPQIWTDMTFGTDAFLAGAAVMYSPGKVMKAGTRDTGGDNKSNVFGKTAKINLNSEETPTWSYAAPASQMISRRNHNLVILPTGEVIVIGGATHGTNDVSADTNCVRMPQIWNPDTLTAGHWYGQERNENGLLMMKFDSSEVRRHYHSTAILMPDGRILVAGGNADEGQQQLADMYSPYYLFKADDTPATRPVISDLAPSIAYGETFPLVFNSGGPAVTKLALIRPGATTHGYDQNQRYVPLTTFQSAQPLNGKPRLLVSAPADSFNALPGDYMLFAMTSAGTPAIARWVRLRATNTAGAPSLTTLIKVCAQPTSVQIEWSPPTVDAATGTTNPGPARQYDMRYKTGTMPTLQDFLSGGTPVSMPTPVDPVPQGQQVLRQNVTIENLDPSTQYTVRMRSKNWASNEGNWSDLGPSLTFTTPAETGECGGSGGGGGGCCQEGASARQAGGYWARRPGGSSGSSGYLENTLFANVRADEAASDLLRLPYGPKWSTDAGYVRLSRTGTLGTRFSRVRLLSVAVPEGQSAFTVGDQIVVGTLSPATSIRHIDGRDLAPQLTVDKPFEGHPGDTLLVDFADATSGRIALETSDAQLVGEPARSGIAIQHETSLGWTTVAHHEPRELRSDALHGVPSTGRLRLVFLGDHFLHGIARFVPGDSPTVTAYEPTSLAHSSRGDVASMLTGDGALIAPGESMIAAFGVTPSNDTNLEWFLEVGGKHIAVATSGTFSNQGGPQPNRPLRFALDQNQPNPFATETRIGFELPVRSQVRLEVFDLLGRRVAVLVNALYEPGRYSITWDRRGNGGGRLPAGVYTCRYSAGDHHELKRIIIFP